MPLATTCTGGVPSPEPSPTPHAWSTRSSATQSPRLNLRSSLSRSQSGGGLPSPSSHSTTHQSKSLSLLKKFSGGTSARVSLLRVEIASQGSLSYSRMRSKGNIVISRGLWPHFEPHSHFEWPIAKMSKY